MSRIMRYAKSFVPDSIGFSLEETMSGHHEFVVEDRPAGKHPMEFTIRWGPENLLTWINPRSNDFLRHPLDGTVSVGGLVEETAVEGFMELRYFSERTIRYVFDFDVDGIPHQFYGEKSNLRLTNLHRTHTTLRGTVSNQQSNQTISKATLYFYWSSLPAMITSLRPKLARSSRIRP